MSTSDVDTDGKAPGQDEVQVLRAQVAELEARFKALTDGLDVGVIIHGPDTEILFANPRAEELLGLSADQLRGKTSFDPRWRALRDDGTDFPPGERPTATAFQTRAPVRGVVVGIHRPEVNDRVWLLVSAIPQLDPGGGIRQVVATFMDITAQKAIEARARAQADEILALSTPLIPVAEGVALVPIVGELDESRAHRMVEVALTGASATGARVLILDFTGVPSIAPEAVPALERAAEACRLVGAQVLITGLRGEAARALTREGATLPGIPTLRSLPAGVRHAFTRARRD